MVGSRTLSVAVQRGSNTRRCAAPAEPFGALPLSSRKGPYARVAAASWTDVRHPAGPRALRESRDGSRPSIHVSQRDSGCVTAPSQPARPPAELGDGDAHLGRRRPRLVVVRRRRCPAESRDGPLVRALVRTVFRDGLLGNLTRRGAGDPAGARPRGRRFARAGGALPGRPAATVAPPASKLHLPACRPRDASPGCSGRPSP